MALNKNSVKKAIHILQEIYPEFLGIIEYDIQQFKMNKGNEPVGYIIKLDRKVDASS